MEEERQEEEKEEVEIKGEEEEDFCVLDDSFNTRNKSEINGQKGTTWNFKLEVSSFKSQRAVLYSELVISAEFGILSVQCSGLLYFLYSVF